MKHEHYTATDFVQDSSFQKWILNKDQEAHAYWSKWLHEHPNKAVEIKKAIDIIETLELDKDVVINTSFIESWKKIESQTLREKTNKRGLWIRAAGFSLLLISGILIYWWGTKSNVYSLSAGNTTTTYILPDSSTITLNKNSEIRYSVNNNEGSREVWLKGEAYFEVKKTV
ncbi:ferric-dicitrate binding protein FerR (iron transport regulator) [Catalinimonas alkaloidigena]|uniref:FecR domain-containing protein n=1 Tax=Catalinimonas alkaloidigena TaxID=1075417 RepID=UPI002405475B|nr:FecR domain-containing protein [Catalinimonas alkaloidigena]MDF9796381.1 ferric-dicitrate binding protein FerR (iron transport regulator) [Catalinimonas alkaloidigena]